MNPLSSQGVNLCSGMLAMQHSSLGLVMVMRNLAPLITFIIEVSTPDRLDGSDES